MIDATIVRAYQHSRGALKKVGQAIGRSKGGLSTKIHTAVDALGNLICFHLTGGQAYELGRTDVLPQIKVCTVIANKGFDANRRLLEPLLQADKRVSSPKSNRKQQ